VAGVAKGVADHPIIGQWDGRTTPLADLGWTNHPNRLWRWSGPPKRPKKKKKKLGVWGGWITPKGLGGGRVTPRSAIWGGQNHP
jgi:hypothetical protein